MNDNTRIVPRTQVAPHAQQAEVDATTATTERGSPQKRRRAQTLSATQDSAGRIPCLQCAHSLLNRQELLEHNHDRHELVYTFIMQGQGSLRVVRDNDLLHCPQCGYPTHSADAFEQHLIFCDCNPEMSAVLAARSRLSAQLPAPHVLPILSSAITLANYTPFLILDRDTQQQIGPSLLVHTTEMGAARETYGHLGNIVEFGLHGRSSGIRFVPDTHRVATAADIDDIVSGGERGLDRLVGAFIISGQSQVQLAVLEVYDRNRLRDPHAERNIPDGSTPTLDPTSTQYPGQIRMVNLKYQSANRFLMIGTPLCNYLVTALLDNGTSIVGAGRCGARFQVSQHSRLHLPRESLATTLPEPENFAQIRSLFGHPATYGKRRGAMCGVGSVYQLPVTVFTLPAVMNDPKLTVHIFYNIWLHWKEQGSPSTVTLRVSDVDPLPTTHSKPLRVAKGFSDLRDMFGQEDSLTLTGNVEAERCLTEIASGLSKSISAKNDRQSKNK